MGVAKDGKCSEIGLKTIQTLGAAILKNRIGTSLVGVISVWIGMGLAKASLEYKEFRTKPLIPSLTPPKKEQNARLNQKLLAAIRGENAATCQALIEEGADPNVRNEKGKTALQIAVSLSKLFTAKVLIDSGANWDVKDWETIHKKLSDSPIRLSHYSARMFMKKRSNLYDLQLFNGEHFETLPQMKKSAELKALLVRLEADFS